MKDAQTKIDGISVNFTVYEESNNCYLEDRGLTGSLALAMSFGGLENEESGEIISIRESTLNKIEAWAVAQGY